MRSTLIGVIALSWLACPSTALAQQASRGVVFPFTVTGGLQVSERGQAYDPGSGTVRAGFRGVVYPGVRISREWFAYSAIQVTSKPFFYYEAYYPEPRLELEIPQFYLGYTHQGEEGTLAFRAGQVPTAFGSFPLRYDDADNPLIDQPPAYAWPVKLRGDQLPCGTDDLVHQQVYPVYVEHYCGGSTQEAHGMIPVSPYGLPGAEMSVSWKRVDARIQLTNSSPTNPQSPTSSSQHLQWTAGGGYTPWHGLRLGWSAFRGPFLEASVEDLLPSGTTVRDYPAVGIGIDFQWARGRWSFSAEWQRIGHHYPGFVRPPSLSSGYVEIRTILDPRFYLAWRGSFTDYRRVTDDGGTTADGFLPDNHSHEFALGYHLSRTHRLKVGYEWVGVSGYAPGNDVFGIQFVTSVPSVSRPF